MRQEQWMRAAGERSREDGESEILEGLGWAERAALRRDARVVTVPRAEAFRYRLRRGAGGRVAAKTEMFGAAEQPWEYAYDPHGKLISARLNGQVVERYAYDSQGRRTQAMCRAFGPVPVRCVYDAGDRLLAMGDVRFAYDAKGRLASWTECGQTTYYEYDGSGFLARVTLPGGGQLTYVHGEDGLPLRKELDGRIVEEFTWRDGLRPASWRDVPGKRLLEFHYEGGRRVPGAMTVYEGGYSYTCALGADQVGTVKTVEDSTGCLIKELQYDSFGNVLEDSAPRFFLPLGFAGGLLDRHTGLVRFGWRDYQPGAGRFTAPDPARWTGGDPDLYDYCVDDPIGKIDPLGLEPGGVEETDSQLGDSQATLIPHDKLYWTFKPKPEACEKCQAMKDVYFENKPSKQVHPNCKCELEGVEASQLPYDRNRIIVPPGVDMEKNMAEATKFSKELWDIPKPPNFEALKKCGLSLEKYKEEVEKYEEQVNRYTQRVKDILCEIRDYFQSGGKYDYKRQGAQYEPFGNYHYGRYMAALRMNDYLARAIAGGYQIYSGTSSIWFITSWFDDPNDQESIRKGQEFPIE